MNKQLIVTTLEDLANYKEGTVVELPPFGPDQPFVARLRRPSMMALAKAGKIPNALLDSANKLFFGNNSIKKYDQDSLKQVFEIIDILCEERIVPFFLRVSTHFYSKLFVKRFVKKSSPKISSK